MLRQATPEDAEAIGRIRVAAWQSAYQAFMSVDFLEGLDPAKNIHRFREMLSDQGPEFTATVAELDGAVVAFSLVGTPRYKTLDNTMELWAINVMPQYSRLGIGSRLIEQAERISAEHGLKRIELWCINGNIPAQLAYSKSGFVASGQKRTTSQLTGHAIDEIHYAKSL